MHRSGIGFDVHRFEPGRKLVLGGVTIPSAIGLAGHSDADVICHAIADALLGAIADGDIGLHFPNTDPRWKDAASIGLLKLVVARVTARGGAVVNVDAAVIAEIPRLAPHVQAMREKLAAALGIGIDRISVKATTAEKLGALGRAEGMAVMATASVELPG